MRLLLEEDTFTVIGAFCVAAFTLAVVWLALEVVLGVGGLPAGIVSFATATCSIEWMSRRHYREPEVKVARAAPGVAARRRPAQATSARQPTLRSGARPARPPSRAAGHGSVRHPRLVPGSADRRRRAA